MPGYSPVCDNCFKCMTCRGNGYVDETRMSNGKVFTERVTCKTCRGVGGKPGAGAHDHR